MIRRGLPTIPRVHARNFHHKQADARLRETVAGFQQQGRNALSVDSFEVHYYQYAASTTICTCKQTEVIPQYSQLSVTAPPTLLDQNNPKSIVIDYNRPLFGTRNEHLTAQDETELDDFELDEDNPEANIIDSTFATNPNCGICYRTGYVPGYNRYGRERIVLTTHDMTNAYGYHVDVTKAPHNFDQTDPTGFVEFVIEVPRYFSQVFYSVRNNGAVLEDMLYTPIGVLTMADLKNAAGSTIAVRVQSQQFTHAVIEFDVGTDPVLANLAQMGKTLDWTLFDTLGNLTIILPMTIPEVHTTDILFVPQRNIVMKVTDVTYLRTSVDANLDWSVTTRVVQPQELIKNIARNQLLA